MVTKFVDRVFLTFFFLIPLLPRPSAEGVEKVIVPAVAAFVFLAWMVAWPKFKPRHGACLHLLGTLLILAPLAYVIRVVLTESYDESFAMISRVLFAALLFATTHWLCTTTVPTRLVFRNFAIGFFCTSLLTIFVGVTRIPILEADSVKPPRYLGLFCKTTGLFRSFGEFAIMGAITWSYLLFFRRTFSTAIWVGISLVVLLALFIAQSRNVYFVLAMITALVVASKTTKIPASLRMALPVLVLCVPLAIEICVPVLKATPIGKQLVGDGDTFEKNVEFRYEQFPLAGRLIRRYPMATIVGLPREHWRRHILTDRDSVVAPHNHFLSNALFLGAGGLIWVIGLYLLPAIYLARRSDHTPLQQLTLFSILGTIAGLSFYEGFFSLTVMMVLALTWKMAFSYQPRAEKLDSAQQLDSAESLSSYSPSSEKNSPFAAVLNS